MKVTLIDERDSTGLIEAPSFRVFDWVGEEALQGQTTALWAYEITGASFWEALKWAESPRDPSPSLSELYACSPDSLNEGGVDLIFLGSLAWRHDPEGELTLERTTLML
ncbi:5-oxo-1,2,5-tricarboxylic-3-penten acid decarboxilase [Leifsonia xyli subsp. cynodontis DSM 46306]|jgi:hypothetical protein|uniref:Uncharacterized protein n=1 Tax=Leifsonia xyli subsp. cynodontis DSM 46306 TaxID=1389489 RepID=U3P207_LEIXC|nr:hypothetical protein [Leifsonia xyli]AGW40345.1 5-oxo-1,2,5-tricarboxylic-3-penten acid decarboxilase [Leifsonia xyli subsp. cynodontis DSM 46306]